MGTWPVTRHDPSVDPTPWKKYGFHPSLFLILPWKGGRINSETVHYVYSSFWVLLLLLLLFFQVNIRTYQCPEEYCHDKEYIVHATADSKERNNSIHYLYSTMHSPTIIVAYFEDVPGPIDLNVSWNKLVKPHPQKDALRFSQDWDHFMAFVVPRVIVFDDPKDELFYTAKHIGTISTRNFATVTWNPPKITGSLVEFTGDFLNGSIRFRVSRLHFISVLYRNTGWTKVSHKQSIHTSM